MSYATVTKVVIEFLKTSTNATTEIDREIELKAAYKRGLELLGDLIVFKLMNNVTPEFVTTVNMLEYKINTKVNELENASRLCRKLRARARREMASESSACVVMSV